MARLGHQRGGHGHSELRKLVLQNQIQFLGNLPNIYNVIVILVLLFWCLALGFVFWADNRYWGVTYPFNNGTSFSMIDSVLMTTSAFTNSGLASAPLYFSTTGGKILMIFAMFSGAKYIFEVLMLYLYRLRLARFIIQVYV
jgi:Trk-type K+ transport system membrane component